MSWHFPRKNIAPRLGLGFGLGLGLLRLGAIFLGAIALQPLLELFVKTWKNMLPGRLS